MGLERSGQQVLTDARVELWGNTIGAVSWLSERELGIFQFVPEFVSSDIEVAPLMMPARIEPYQFPALGKEAFRGLPGLLSDSLPDRFGNTLINAWLARQGRTAASFNPVERLCYTGSRGMGALEFRPVLHSLVRDGREVRVAQLVELANDVLNQRAHLAGRLDGEHDQRAIEDILRVGTSAGGARAKAILAWNPQTGEFRSGQVETAAGFQHWLMKFDGVSNNRDRELADPLGFGRIEYAYSLMARAAGLEMMECRLHEEGGRAHFMTRRFDRTDRGAKLHYQSLGAMMHYDFNQPGAYGYEQAIQTIKRLDLPMPAVTQQVRRAIFNIIARNQDDHVKNIGFLMNPAGEWRLAPAFDVVYAWNPDGDWTSHHQMSLNGKRTDFVREDLITFARTAGMKPRQANGVIDEVTSAVKEWPVFADEAAMGEQDRVRIEKAFRFFE